MLALVRMFPFALMALLLGVVFGVLDSFGWVPLLLVALSVLSVAFVLTRRRWYGWGLILCAILLLGGVRGVYWKEGYEHRQTLIRVDVPLTLRVYVDEEPDRRESMTHVASIVRQVNGETMTEEVRVRLSLLPFPAYAYGDVLEVQGKTKLPEVFTTDQGRVFDYPMYLATKGVTHTMMLPRVEIVAREGMFLMHTLLSWKHGMIDVLEKLYPDPHQALLSGMLLGEKRSLGEEWIDYFTRAGIVHIVVLSGYNMTIVAQWLMVMFRPLGFYPSLGLGALGIVGFTIMTGAGATVVRAGIMALLALLARALGRAERMGRALLIAGVLMVMHEPAIIVYDPSFQLSFLATLGLVFVSPVIESRMQWFRNQPLFREVVIATCATQVTVLPFLLYLTGMLSVVALPVNLLLLPFMPLVMLLGVVSVVLSFVPFLGTLVALPTTALLDVVLEVSRLSAELPLATFAVQLPLLFTAMLYGCVVFVIWKMSRALPVPR
jgi:competence protein ComEC